MQSLVVFLTICTICARLKCVLYFFTFIAYFEAMRGSNKIKRKIPHTVFGLLFLWLWWVEALVCIFGHKYEGYNLLCGLIPGKGRVSFHSFSWLHTSRLPAQTLPVAPLQTWIQRLQIPVVLLMCGSGALPVSLPCQRAFSAPASWHSSMGTEARWK